MKVFKFDVTLEDYPDVIRVIEMREDQSFEDLHNAILSSVNFDNTQLASFYICNEDWDKKIEITLIDMAADDSDMIPIMQDTLLKDYLTNAKGQKLIYEYDFVLMWRFLIELTDITAAQNNIKYPRVVASVGEAPMQYETTEKYPDEVTDEDSQYIRDLTMKNLDLFHGSGGADDMEEKWGDEEDDEFGSFSDDDDKYGFSDEDDY